MQSTLNKLFKGSSITFGGVILGTAGQFVVRALIGRELGAEGYGILTLGLATLYFLSVFSTMAMDIGVARFIPFYFARNKFSKIAATLKVARKIVVIISTIIAIVLFLSSNYIALHLFAEPEVASILKIFALILPFFGVQLVQLGGLRGFKRMDYLTYTDQIARQTGLIIVALLTLLLSLSAFWVSVGYALVFLIVFGLTFYFLNGLLNRHIGKGNSDSGNEKTIVKNIFSFSWPLVASQQFAESRKRLDPILLGFLGSAQMVGIFNAALPISRIMQVILTSLNKIFLPSATELYAEGEMDELKKIYQLTSKWVFFLTLPLYLFLLIHAKEIIQIVFGQEYLSAEIPLMILSTGFFLNTISGSFGEMLIAIGRPKVNMLASALALAINVIANFIFIPIYGVSGAAIAAAFSLFSIILVGGGTLYYLLGIQPFTYGHLKGLLASILLIIFFILFNRGERAWFLLVVRSIVILGTSYILFIVQLYFYGAFEDEEKKMIKIFCLKIKERIF